MGCILAIEPIGAIVGEGVRDTEDASEVFSFFQSEGNRGGAGTVTWSAGCNRVTCQ